MTGQTATPRHPNTLHALTAAWSLQVARQQLDHAIQCGADQPRDGLRSCAGGSVRSRGGHGDPVGNIALAPTKLTGNESLTRLERATTSTLTWLADTLRLTAGPDPMWRILDGLPRLQPGTTEQLRRWLVDHDARIRTALGLGPDEQVLPGAECPACGRRPMTACTAAPDPADWTVVCTAGCRCAGQGCGCAMLVQVEGAVHIWPGAVDLVAAMELAQWPRRWLVGLTADGGEAA
ncbi:hypothetical protein ACQEVC_45575 [Plantactinospora sp. CA-294935]|uniref:hypothetical protein n=1 Tax=Plantactinospora sp. CA-294935 TaxID=3240012 RepID=UPI003D8E9BB1